MTARRGYPAVDRFRMAAALLVVCIHTAPLASVSPDADFALKTLARTAVPFFLLATGFFVLGPCAQPGLREKMPPEGVRRFAGKTAALYAGATLLYLPVTIYAGNLPGRPVAVNAARDILLDGTFYHLWYLPAALLGVLLVWALLRAVRPGAAAVLCGALYVIGLGGDSLYGAAARFPALAAFYGGLFSAMDYTRNGLFFAPLFLLWGALAARPDARWRKYSLRVRLAAFALSLALLLGEAFALRAAGWPRHDSMYVSLAPCALLLFVCLLERRGSGSRLARDASMLLYILHPLVIVAVRGAAKMLDMRWLLVENSLVHFLAVAAVSSAAALSLAQGMAVQRARRAAGKPAEPRETPGQKRRLCTRAWVEVDLDAVAHNAAALRACLPASCRVMAVVKADAYGHGAQAVAGRLWAEGVRAFAVATPEEGAALRRCGIGGEILVLGYTPASRVRELRRWRLCQTVADPAHARALSRAAGRRSIGVHIAVDTGMHRLGTAAQAVSAVAEMFTLPGLDVRGMFTHLAVSDGLSPEASAFTREQLARFAALAQQLRAAGHTLPVLHTQASFGILNWPELHFDMARPGIALYGPPGMPGQHTRAEADLRPALALRARVVCVRRLAPGERAGYGCAFTACRETLLAVVAIGYADGWPRAAGAGNSAALLRGRRAPVVGRVCMDQLLLDATQTGAAVGDVATLIGRDGREQITAGEAARRLGTIPNELLCTLGPRLPRIYL